MFELFKKTISKRVAGRPIFLNLLIHTSLYLLSRLRLLGLATLWSFMLLGRHLSSQLCRYKIKWRLCGSVSIQ